MKCCLPFSDSWVILVAGKSIGGRELGVWARKEETGVSVSSDSCSVSTGGGSGSNTEIYRIESEKKSRKAKPTNRRETANFTNTWLCLWNDDGDENGFDDEYSDLISFTIWCRREAKKTLMQRESIEAWNVEMRNWFWGGWCLIQRRVVCTLAWEQRELLSWEMILLCLVYGMKFSLSVCHFLIACSLCVAEWK